MDKLVQTWMALSRTQEIQEAAAAVSKDQAALLALVKALGEYLTSEDGQLRQRGVEFLSLVLAEVSKETLNRQSVRVLTGFFCQKLEDFETVKPALNGLLTLVGFSSFSPAETTTVLENLFLHVKMKSLVQSVRFIVFSIIDSLMAHHRNAVKSMGKAFLNGYCPMAEGEKDPRNLMVAFAIARVILIEFDVSEHVEALFNVTFCYFPITFRPPPNDPYGITTDDLRLALRRCLSATPLFGQLSIPVFLEKLTAGSRVTKKDTLQTMAACLPVYGAALARSVARKLWNALKLEIFQPVDTETEGEALKTTQILVQTIYSEEEAALESNEDIQGFARDACSECIDILKEPEKSQAKPATKILCSFISTTPSVSRFTISQAVPHLIRLFLDPDEASTQPATLGLLHEFVEAARLSTTRFNLSTPPAAPYKDGLLGVFTVGLKNTSTRLPALSGLKSLVQSDNLLSDEELGFVVHNITELFKGNQEAFDNASDEILDVLSTISDISPVHVAEQTLPFLFQSLPDKAPTRDEVEGRDKILKALSCLQTLCVHPDHFETLVVRLTTKLDLLCFPPSLPAPSPANLEEAASYAHALLKTISQTLDLKVKKKHTDVSKYVDGLVFRVVNIFVYSACLSGTQPVVATETKLITAAAEIVNLVVRSIPEMRQQVVSAAVGKALNDGDVSAIAQGFHKIPDADRFSIFANDATAPKRNTLALLSAVVVALRPEAPLPVSHADFLELLLKWALETADNDIQRLASLHIVAATVNRRADDLHDFLQEKLNHYWGREIINTDRSLTSRIWAIEAWTWITKALVVRKHPLSVKFTERLYDAFDDPSIDWDVAKALGEVLGADPVFTKENHAQIKILYVQKYAALVLPRVIKSASSNDNLTEQTASLVAVTAVIRTLPCATYGHHMTALIPLLLRGLDLPDLDIKANVIETLLSAAEGESPEKSLVAEHASSLVQSMLKYSRVTEAPSVKVRVAALKYLAVLPSIVRYDILHPQRAIVLRELSMALDDPKRVVRKEAVVARTNWFKYKG